MRLIALVLALSASAQFACLTPQPKDGDRPVQRALQMEPPENSPLAWILDVLNRPILHEAKRRVGGSVMTEQEGKWDPIPLQTLDAASLVASIVSDIVAQVAKAGFEYEGSREKRRHERILSASDKINTEYRLYRALETHCRQKAEETAELFTKQRREEVR